MSLNYNLSVYNAELGLLRAKPVRIQNCDSPFELTLNDLRRNKPYHVYLSVKSDDNTYSFKSKEVYFSEFNISLPNSDLVYSRACINYHAVMQCNMLFLI